MSTELYEIDGPHKLTLTQYGGKHGLSIQITGWNCDNKLGYVGMMPEEARAIAKKLKQWARGKK